MTNYQALARAQLSYDYLHTNSTTHEFLFGALAELVDNARDASATKMNVFTVDDSSLRGGYMLGFLDDGEGMDSQMSADIITFGKSFKKSSDAQYVGMYGNGLKSGSMRIGNDFILFTKRNNEMTCVFLSRTFHEEESIDEIIVPMPVFDATSRRPLAKSASEKAKHQIEMNIILKYSPFKTEADFMKQFQRIEGTSGTLVIIYNLKLLDTGEPELDVKTDPEDIILANPEVGDFDSDEGHYAYRLVQERKSFRAYTSLLYVDPRMRIYVQGKKVRTKRLIHCLYKPRIYKYQSSRFKTRSEAEVKKSQEEARIADNKAREAESKARNLEDKYGTKGTKEQRAQMRKAQTVALECRRDANLKKQMAERKAKGLKDPKTLHFIFGINLENRNQDGMFVYNCSRLIKMYQKVGPQTDGGSFCSGVVGVVDVPYLVLEPTHNKQDFADAKEYRHLQKAMGEHMVQYWKDVNISAQGVTKFWESFGYVSPIWKDPCSDDPKFQRKRAMQLQVTLQCDVCLKWRMLPFSSNHINKEFPDNWVCLMNPDPSHNRCSAPEQKLAIPEGILKKEIKSQEQKQRELAEEIARKQSKLEQLQKIRQVTSSKQVKDMDEKPMRKKFKEESSEEEEDEEDLVAKAREETRIFVVTPSNVLREVEDSKQAAALAVSQAPQNRSSRQSSKDSEVTARRSQEAPRRAAATSSKSASRSSRTTKRAAISQSSEDSEEESPEEEDEDDIPPPPKRKTPKVKTNNIKTPTPSRTVDKPSSTQSPQSPTKLTRIQRMIMESEGSEADHLSDRKDKDEEDEDEEGMTPVLQSKVRVSRIQKMVQMQIDKMEEAKQNAAVLESDGDSVMDVDNRAEPDEGQPVSGDETDADVGTKVEAKIKDKWHSGLVVQVNRAQMKWKVKFDQYPKDKYDKWIDISSPDLKTSRGAGATNHAIDSSIPPASHSPTSETANETPSSSTHTAAPIPGTAAAYAEDIANGYRTCLRYFLPPQWVMDKDAVSALGVAELASFPLDDFFDHYEKGLRKLVSSFQLDAQTKQQEAEQAKSKLSQVRKMIAKLLKSINEEFDIDPESDSDQVDELLAACVKQAVQQQQQQQQQQPQPQPT